MTRAVFPLAFAAAALVAATSAGAATWQFEYTGLNDPNAGINIISSAGGTFEANDLNHDGLITQDEVTQLSFLDYQVAPTSSGWSPFGDLPSRLDSFHYAVGTNDFKFAAFAGNWGDSIDKTETNLHWITGIGDFHYDLTSSAVGLTVSQLAGPAIAPVPEPSTWALATLGLAAIGVARRRRSER